MPLNDGTKAVVFDGQILLALLDPITAEEAITAKTIETSLTWDQFHNVVEAHNLIKKEMKADDKRNRNQSGI